MLIPWVKHSPPSKGGYSAAADTGQLDSLLPGLAQIQGNSWCDCLAVATVRAKERLEYKELASGNS